MTVHLSSPCLSQAQDMDIVSDRLRVILLICKRKENNHELTTIRTLFSIATKLVNSVMSEFSLLS